MLKYHKQNLTISLEDHINHSPCFRKVSFTIDLAPKESIELAYCIPYLYSNLLSDIKKWKYTLHDVGE